ncbi:DEKNAAC104829 [Brettanomyces naardenensis]|uniref:1-phosphatidylinositol 4-kinase n=1 Tax=Brettanomyces naardenensis TaxID=13370 RepID=A0A448YS42_BRENA|nr:DEKNAAC104829 [Brettanomyces naardenensis]
MTDSENSTSPSDLWASIQSPDFDLYQCIEMLRCHYDNVGIQYQLCRRAMAYPIGELRFFVPEFLQLLITVETQSLALEEMMKLLCSRDAHFSLITFWHLQALLQQLGAEPESVGFQTCKRLINELQYQLFNYYARSGGASSSPNSTGLVSRHDMNQNFRENLAPAIALQTSLLAGITVPETVKYVEPIVRIQGKRVKTLVFEVLRDVKKSLTENLTKKNTLNNARLTSSLEGRSVPLDVRRTKSVSLNRDLKQHPDTESERTTRYRKSEDLELDMVDSYADANLPNLRRPSLKFNRSAPRSKPKFYGHSATVVSLNNPDKGSPNSIDHMIASMPDLHTALSPDGVDFDGSYASSIRNSFEFRDSSELEGSGGEDSTPLARRAPLTRAQQVKLLKSNYFKNTTQFVIALQNISIRLSKVPREARLSTLKAELSLLNNDLPCEVDIPTLLPKNKSGKLHKLCHIAVNESAVLNSAERVPYLLLIEYFSDGMDFNPDSPANREFLQNREKFGDDGKYRFDLAYRNTVAPDSGTPVSSSSTILTGKRVPSARSLSEAPGQRIEESDLGDVSVVRLTNKIDDRDALMFPTKSFFSEDQSLHNQIRDIELSLHSRTNDTSEHDKNLTVQLRIAGIMLRQLESSNSTLPASQAVQIRSRIVESMKSMQDSFESFDSGKSGKDAAGERKLSNDLKVAGLSYLGEDWNTKKERIRRQSKYGHCEDWDLFSVIAKTGDDLAQESFACQLIQTMANLWYKDGVRIWVKRMRILVTSSNTGLVETITNALSVHSIKKSLTEHMLQKGELQPGEIATLKDHFIRLFGNEDSARYKIAQQNFGSSLAAYSIICYLLQIKDRHNGNIMIDSEGHIIHIDFGFLLSNSPGSVGFESAPFKLTQEYVDVLGGVDSYYFQQFKQLTKNAFKSIRKYADSLIDTVQLMQTDSPLPCFRAGENTSVLLKQRLQLHLTDEEVDAFTEDFLINKSINSAYTRLYDQFQMLTQGIYV